MKLSDSGRIANGANRESCHPRRRSSSLSVRSEETTFGLKPMVIEIGGKPILWHIPKIYKHYGVDDFTICCGYKGDLIKEYVANRFLHVSGVTFYDK